MTFTLSGLVVEGVPPLDEGYDFGIAVHEIAGADYAYVQSTGKLNGIYPYELYIDDDQLATLKTYLALGTATYVLTDSVNGITAINVRISSCVIRQVTPDLWKASLTLVRKAL